MPAALVVIDLQNDVLDGCVRVDPVLAATRTLLTGARAAGVPVVWVQHQGPGLERDTDGWRIHPALDPSPGEPVVAKSYRDAFAGTTLRATLGDADHLVLCGAQTDYCVRTTAQRAAADGYDLTWVTDAHTTYDVPTADGVVRAEDVIAQHDHYFRGLRYPGQVVRAVTAAEVSW
jgi:nicotinamidase-related amidase